MLGGFLHSGAKVVICATICFMAFLWSACGKKANEAQTPDAKPPSLDASGDRSLPDLVNQGPVTPVVETLATEPILQKVQSLPASMREARIDTLAWVGHTWSHVFKRAGNNAAPGGEIIAGPQGMVWAGDTLRFIPAEAGLYLVKLRMPGPPGSAGEAVGDGQAAKVRSFQIEAVRPMSIKVGVPTGPIMTGQKTNFSLSLAIHPGLKLRMAQKPESHAGNVTWKVRIGGMSPSSSPSSASDTDWTAVATEGEESFAWTFTQAGEKDLHVSVLWQGVVADSARIKVGVLAPVGARLTAPKDTLEPGSKAVFIIDQIKGNPPFRLSLDADGDGKPDWMAEKGMAEGAGGRVPVVMPRSGRFIAKLQVVDGKGQSGVSEAQVVVNQRIKVKASALAQRVNMATPFELKLEYADADDSVVGFYAHMPDTLQGSQGRDSVAPQKQQASSEEKKIGKGKVYWSRHWPRVGFYPVKLCAIAGDMRQACAEIKLEVFNAEPVCKIVTDIKPVPGVPTALRGEAHDPDGVLRRFEWDIDHDGRYEWLREENQGVPYTFAKKGKFPVRFQVTSADGKVARDSAFIEVKNKW